jgi:hypothetical protein
MKPIMRDGVPVVPVEITFKADGPMTLVYAQLSGSNSPPDLIATTLAWPLESPTVTAAFKTFIAATITHIVEDATGAKVRWKTVLDETGGKPN